MFHSKSPVTQPGHGMITLTSDPSNRAIFSTLAYTYPLKLQTPTRYFGEKLAVVFMLSYGGGFLGGDEVDVKIRVEEGTGLVVCTQGSTKIFKTRRDTSTDSHYSNASSILSDDPPPEPLTTPTSQSLDVVLTAHSSLYLLPCPITPFASSSYTQSQSFHLTGTSNLLLLDWYTSGRMERGEEWEFDRYSSVNEIWVDDVRVVRDVQLLKDEQLPLPTSSSPTSSAATTSAAAAASSSDAPVEQEARGRQPRSYVSRVAPYSVYATLILLGPQLEQAIAHWETAWARLTQFPQTQPYSVIWSVSPLSLPTTKDASEANQEGAEVEEGQKKKVMTRGAIVRIGGATTEEVKDFVCNMLDAGGVRALLGEDCWRTATSG